MASLTWKESRFLSVPLQPEEIQARGEQLADLVKERDELEVEQKKERERMKDALEGITGRIRHLAKIVNDRVEERSVQVEVRYNSALNMVEEVRIDTGEVIKTRNVTQEDKIRASAEAQTIIPGTEPPPAEEKNS